MPGLYEWILAVLDKRSGDGTICGYKNCSNSEHENEGNYSTLKNRLIGLKLWL